MLLVTYRRGIGVGTVAVFSAEILAHLAITFTELNSRPNRGRVFSIFYVAPIANFHANQTSGWYFQMLDDLIRPWRAGPAATTHYFFSRYLVPLYMDDADTEINNLPPNFKQPSQYGDIHRS